MNSRRVECGRRSGDEAVIEPRLPTDRHFDAGRYRCVGHDDAPLRQLELLAEQSTPGIA